MQVLGGADVDDVDIVAGQQRRGVDVRLLGCEAGLLPGRLQSSGAGSASPASVYRPGRAW